MRNLSLFSFLSLVVFALVIVSSCKKDNKDEDITTVKKLTIGVVLPLDLEKGLLRQNALTLAVNEINAAGGVGSDYEIDLLIKSSAGQNREEAAAQAARQIIDESTNLVGFISCFSSSSLGIVNQISIPDQYPTLSGAATSEALNGISTYFQRLCPPDNYQAQVLSDQAITYGLSKVAIAVEAGDAYSSGLAASFQDAFGNGSEVMVNFSPDDPNYTDKINQLLEGDPDAVFVSMLNPASYNTFFTHLDQLNKGLALEDITFILCDALYSDNLFQSPISYLTGEVNGHPKNFGTLPSADTSTSEYIYFKNRLMEKYQQDVASYNAQFFDAGYLFALALEKSFMETDISDIASFRETLKEQIRMVSHGETGAIEVSAPMGWNTMKSNCAGSNINYTGASGNCDIDDEGNTQTAYAVFKVTENGGSYAFEILKIVP